MSVKLVRDVIKSKPQDFIEAEVQYKDLEEKNDKKQNIGFVSSIKKFFFRVMDLIFSPTMLKVLSFVSVAFFVASTTMTGVIIPIIALSVIGSGVAVAIESVRLRNYHRAFLENALLKELKEHKYKMNEKDQTSFTTTKIREHSAFYSFFKETGNILWIDSVCMAISVLSLDPIAISSNIFITSASYILKNRMRSFLDEGYVQLKNESDEMKRELGINYKTSEVQKLLALYKKNVPVESQKIILSEAKVPTLMNAAYNSLFVNGLSYRKTLLAYDVRHGNTYMTQSNVDDKESGANHNLSKCQNVIYQHDKKPDQHDEKPEQSRFQAKVNNETWMGGSIR